MSLSKLINTVASSDKRGLLAIKLYVAVLLFRLIRSDGNSKMLELVSMSELLRKEFSLSQDSLEEIFALANEKQLELAKTSVITADVCKGLSKADRVELLEYLWRLAFSDGCTDKAEVALIEDVALQLELTGLEQATAQENAEMHLGLHLFF